MNVEQITAVILESDPAARAAIAADFKRRGCNSVSAATRAEAMELLASRQPAVLVSNCAGPDLP